MGGGLLKKVPFFLALQNVPILILFLVTFIPFGYYMVTYMYTKHSVLFLLTNNKYMLKRRKN